MLKVLWTYNTSLVKCSSSHVQDSQIYRDNFITKEKCMCVCVCIKQNSNMCSDICILICPLGLYMPTSRNSICLCWKESMLQLSHSLLTHLLLYFTSMNRTKCIILKYYSFMAYYTPTLPVNLLHNFSVIHLPVGHTLCLYFSSSYLACKLHLCGKVLCFDHQLFLWPLWLCHCF